ncbi:retrovirus-related pol polyprotein from transposon TNT 1-94 [Tanacetum coccineum]
MKRHGKTSYDVFRGRSPDFSYFHVFRCPVFIYNHRYHLGKLDEMADDGFFLGYSPLAKAFRVFKIKRQELEETFHVTFNEVDEENPIPDLITPIRYDDSIPYVPTFDPLTKNNITIPDLITPITEIISPSSESPDSPVTNDHHASVTTKSRVRDSEAASAHECIYAAFLSNIKPKRVIDALKEEGWVLVMQKELNQFKRNKVWTLVLAPHGKTIIGTKWIYRNKMDENGVVLRNKAILVTQGYKLEEGIDYDETLTPVERVETVRIFFAYVAYMGFVVYQMDVKSAFLNEKLTEEVYVQQPPRFESSDFPNYVCKQDKLSMI